MNKGHFGSPVFSKPSESSAKGSFTERYKLLIKAISENKISTVDTIISQGMDVNSTIEDRLNWCPLAAAISTRGSEMFEHLIKTHEADLQIKHPEFPAIGLVFEAIWQERFDLVKILVENGVDINKKIFLNQIQIGEFHVLHAAILFEFKRFQSDFPWTRQFVEMGADPANKSHWSSNFDLGFQGNYGDAFQFASELQRRFPEKPFAKLLDFLRDSRQIKLVNTFQSTGTNKKKEKKVTTNKPNERQQNLNCLELIKAGDIEKLTFTLNQGAFKINKRIQNIDGLQIDGPIIISAINHQNLAVIDLLATRNAVTVNEKILWNNNSSHVLNFAMAKAIEYDNLKIAKKLLDLGSHTGYSGWIKLKNFEAFGLPISLAQNMHEVMNNATSKSLVELLVRHHKWEWEKSSLENLDKEIRDDCKLIEIQRRSLSMKVGIIASRVEKSKAIWSQIKSLESSLEFLTKEEISLEQREVQKELSEPKRILQEIRDIENSPGYLDPSKIGFLEVQVASASREYRPPHLECVGCKGIPTPQLGNIVQIYTCTQKHNFCQTCLSKTDFCNVCKQDFKKSPPNRNKSVEDEIEWFNAKKKKEEEQEAALMNLPDGMADEMKLILSMKRKAKEAVKKLEDKVEKARELESRKKNLEMNPNYKTEAEIDHIQKRSDDKITKARDLQQKVAALKVDPGFLDKDRQKKHKEILEKIELSNFKV